MRWAALLLLVIGCSDGATAVGDPCTDGVECPEVPGTACILAWPEGYCTEIDCSLGSCANGALCVDGLTFANVPYRAFCLDTCKVDADCRDRYRCGDVQRSEKVCVPSMP
jgi:hypothetical protein